MCCLERAACRTRWVLTHEILLGSGQRATPVLVVDVFHLDIKVGLDHGLVRHLGLVARRNKAVDVDARLGPRREIVAHGRGVSHKRRRFFQKKNESCTLPRVDESALQNGCRERNCLVDVIEAHAVALGGALQRANGATKHLANLHGTNGRSIRG